MWHRLRWVVLGILVVALCGELVSAFLVERSTATAQARARAAHAQLDADLAAALKVGYSEGDLASGRLAAVAIAAETEPLAPWKRPAFYSGQATRFEQADVSLKETEAQLDANAKQDLDQQVAGARAGIEKSRTIDVPAATVGGLAARLDALTKAQAEARVIVDLRKADTAARQLAADVTAANTAQQA